MTSLLLCYVITTYFLFIWLFGGSYYRVHSFIILLSSVLNLCFQLPESTNITEYVFNRNVAVLWDGATAFILTMFLVVDKLAWKQALLLAFATLCHIMIIYDITIASSLLSLFFYNYYDELIITVGLLQMTVSSNGINTSFHNIWTIVRRCSSDNRGYSKSGATSNVREV